MKNKSTASTDFWGALLILVAIVAGFFVANALYNWEKNSRARAAAGVAATTVSLPTKEPAQGKSTEISPAPKETVPPPKATPVGPDVTTTAPTTSPPSTSPSQVSFRQDVLPILQKNCAFCHGTMGGLDLKDHKALMTTGNNKPQVVPGKPQESLLVKRMEQKPVMPPSGALPESDLDKIKQWIVEGAKDN